MAKISCCNLWKSLPPMEAEVVIPSKAFCTSLPPFIIAKSIAAIIWPFSLSFLSLSSCSFLLMPVSLATVSISTAKLRAASISLFIAASSNLPFILIVVVCNANNSLRSLVLYPINLNSSATGLSKNFLLNSVNCLAP